jgi:signal transduction histidine kinase
MLHEFIRAHRRELIARTRTKVASRTAPRPTEDELKNGVPLFLGQLIEALRAASPSPAAIGQIEKSAALHGGDLLKKGFTVAQVVHDYGDVCQAVTELALEIDAPITTDEFHTLNRCLDDAIAQAVTEYTRLRERSLSEEETQRSGILAHELRNRLSAATLAFQMLKKGSVAINGSVAGVVTRNLLRLSTLIDRSLLEVRVDSGSQCPRSVAVWELIEEAEVDGAMEAGARSLALTVAPVDRAIYINADPHIVSGAIANLLHNAFKFTREGGHVALTASATATRVLIDVADECGGLPPGKASELFEAFEQRGTDRSGLGLGLFISRKGVEASGGVMRVDDRPGAGCVFTIDLPRLAVA